MEGIGGNVVSAAKILTKWRHNMFMVFQFYFDKANPHSVYRWIGSFVLVIVFVLRIQRVQGFYAVIYGLGIYMLNLLIGFLSPYVDPEFDPSDEMLKLPTKGSDGFKPFIRRLPEFQLWFDFTIACFIALCLTFIPILDIPVFWPVLLCCWFVCFGLTMRNQIKHMIKHKYIPFSIGKQRYGGKKSYPCTCGSRCDSEHV